MLLPSLFRRLRCRMYILEIWIFSFLPIVGYCSAVVMEIWIVNLCSYAEDCCDGVVIFLIAGTEIFGFLFHVLDRRADVALILCVLIYCRLVLVHAVQPDACFP
jgi:hypothetical protein